MMRIALVLCLIPVLAIAQQVEEDTGDLRDRFIKPPEGVEFNDEYVEEAIKVERPESRSVAGNVALLRGLDKISGRVQDIEIRVGEAAMYERLTIKVDHCRRPPEDEADDAFVYMRISDSKGSTEPGGTDVFAGWMFASSPALSAMDHQRYDVWVLSCTTS